ncbi:DUF1853 family protein [Pleionea mediterranea]|uniref:DUF1853 family protein n=1 Tax=Pleionea mediterranea TaxID=523701 RepID=A0A316FWJ9_9GAMM|nr:DUF1853 family protein [Pleionea mediterranea]PWK51970.1 hypothetical protein C8D97_105287 [Pleionea mediterranea]
MTTIVNANYHFESQQQLLSNLLWCIGSPEIINNRHGFFSDEGVSKTFYSRLKQTLEQQPDVALKLIKGYLSELKTKRLGERFEAYWNAAIELHPDYRLITSNFPLRDQGKTLGELDLVIQCLKTEQLFHIELTCKFYLQVPGVSGLRQWVGPGQADRLDKKIHRLEQHQLQLPQTPIASSLLEKNNLDIKRSYSVIKGRLYTSIAENKPDFDAQINDASVVGRWATRQQLEQQLDYHNLHWCIAKKHQWFASFYADQTHSLEKLLSEDISYPKQLVGFCDGKERVRVFWVEDDWLQQAKLIY